MWSANIEKYFAFKLLFLLLNVYLIIFDFKGQYIIYLQKQSLEVFYKEGIFKTSQNTCARVSFLVKLQA